MHTGLQRRGLTLVELLVVIGLVGVLVALALPATLSAREAVRRAQCANNLKQIGIAFQLYAEVHGVMPGAPDCPWTVGVLPHLEQRTLAGLHRTNASPLVPENQTIGTTAVNSFLCPSEPRTVLSNGWVVSNYAGNAASLGLRPAEFTDGMTNTAMAADIPSHWLLPWVSGPSSSPGSLILAAHGNLRPVLFGDGRAALFSSQLPAPIWDAMTTPDGGEVLGPP